MLTRRGFLISASAAAAAAALPLPTIAAAVPVAPVAPVAPVVPKAIAFAFGTGGEFDWRPIFASSYEEAERLIRSECGYEDEEYLPYDIERVEAWDHRGAEEKVTAADWIRAGMGHNCSRCRDETFAEDGALVVGDEVVCRECLSLAERVALDPDWAIDEIAEHIIDEGADAAREWLEQAGAWEAAAPHWAKALEQAA